MFIYIYLYLDIFISKIRQDGTSASLIKKIHVFSLLEMKQDHKPKSWPPKKSKLILLDFSFFLSFQNFFLFNLKKKKVTSLMFDQSGSWLLYVINVMTWRAE